VDKAGDAVGHAGGKAIGKGGNLFMDAHHEGVGCPMALFFCDEGGGAIEGWGHTLLLIQEN